MPRKSREKLSIKRSIKGYAEKAKSNKLLELFSTIPDYRKPQGKRHKIEHILYLSVLAGLMGATDYKQISIWIEKHIQKDKVKRLLGVEFILTPKKSVVSSIREKEILKDAFKHSEKLKEVYNFSNQLTKILDTKITRNGGIRRLKNWIAKVKDSDISYFKTFIGTLEKHIEDIANYFIERESSGFVEGFNNRIKVLRRRCYGIVDRVYLFRRISLDIGGNQASPIRIDGL